MHQMPGLAAVPEPVPPKPEIKKQSRISTYLWPVAVKKVSYIVAKVAVGLIMSIAVKMSLDKYGVYVDPVWLLAGITTVVAAALEWAHDYAKLKLGLHWL